MKYSLSLCLLFNKKPSFSFSPLFLSFVYSPVSTNLEFIYSSNIPDSKKLNYIISFVLPFLAMYVPIITRLTFLSGFT